MTGVENAEHENSASNSRNARYENTEKRHYGTPTQPS